MVGQFVALQNAPGSYYWNNYCYDGNGNLQYAAYRFAAPNQNNNSCSGAGDSYTYDTLGRVLPITHGDNSTMTYSYNGRATQVTDENGVSRVVQLDGLWGVPLPFAKSPVPRCWASRPPTAVSTSRANWISDPLRLHHRLQPRECPGNNGHSGSANPHL